MYSPISQMKKQPLEGQSKKRTRKEAVDTMTEAKNLYRYTREHIKASNKYTVRVIIARLVGLGLNQADFVKKINDTGFLFNQGQIAQMKKGNTIRQHLYFLKLTCKVLKITPNKLFGVSKG